LLREAVQWSRNEVYLGSPVEAPRRRRPILLGNEVEARLHEAMR
jgi:hypothetical protein